MIQALADKLNVTPQALIITIVLFVGAFIVLWIKKNAHRLTDADGVGQLDVAAAGQTGGDHVLGGVPGHVGGGAVYRPHGRGSALGASGHGGRPEGRHVMQVL